MNENTNKLKTQYRYVSKNKNKNVRAKETTQEYRTHESINMKLYIT